MASGQCLHSEINPQGHHNGVLNSTVNFSSIQKIFNFDTNLYPPKSVLIWLDKSFKVSIIPKFMLRSILVSSASLDVAGKK